jgi:hypothetical protein
MKELEELFLKIIKILEENSNNFLTTKKYMDSQSKQVKPRYHLYGNKKVSLFGKKPKNVYIADVI